MNDQSYLVALVNGYSEPDRFLNDLNAAKARAIERSYDDDTWGIWREGDGCQEEELLFVVVGQQLFERVNETIRR
jgi:hypothetical protein